MGELGLHPWEFNEYSLIEYLQKRKGYNKKRKDDYQRMLVSSMLPYMKKEDRVRIVSQAFREEGGKVVSLRERYEALKAKHADALNAPPLRILKGNHGK
jgi:hypothetical protein